jgi:pre-mRNA-processing factor 8
MPAFTFDKIINPLPFYRAENSLDKNTTTEIKLFETVNQEEFEIPEDFQPFLFNQPLFDHKTNEGIDLMWAPKPFQQRSGKTRRAFDIPLVATWFKERCD